MKRVISILLVLGMMSFAFVSADAQRTVMQVKEPKEAAAEAPAEAGSEEIEASAEDEMQVKAEPEAKEPEAGAVLEKKEEAKAKTKSEPETEKDPAEDTQAVEKSFDDKDIVRNENPVTMYVKSPVNVRSGPSTDYDIVGNVTEGTELEVLGRYTDKGWYLINYNGQEAFVSHNYLVKDKPEPAEEPAQAKAPEAQTQPAPAPQTQPTPQSQTQPVPAQQAQAQQQEDMPQAASILFIGDSRCVQMKAAVGGGGCSWICENSKGYDWLESKAIGQADRIIGKGTKVVVCLGVNDTEHVQKYAALVNQKAAEWAARGAKTYYVSVNPVSTNPYRTEEEVQSFNAAMPGLLSGVTWIDTHSVLVSNGYKLVDGLHFNEEGSVYIFNLIISSLR